MQFGTGNKAPHCPRTRPVRLVIHRSNGNIAAMLTRLRPRLTVLPVLCLAAPLSLIPGASSAHPHIFIDAGLHLVIEQGRVTAIEVTWVYDELYSLLLMQDYGLDEDFDLALTEAEVAQMLGFDLEWTHGFEGGLTLHRGDVALQIGPPEPVSLSLVGPGQFQTVHRRAVVDPGGADRLDAQVYDPEFYVAFEMTGEMAVEGATCDIMLIRADLDAAYEALDTAMAEIGGAVSEEDNFPAVGAFFADRVTMECTP